MHVSLHWTRRSTGSRNALDLVQRVAVLEAKVGEIEGKR